MSSLKDLLWVRSPDKAEQRTTTVNSVTTYDPNTHTHWPWMSEWVHTPSSISPLSLTCALVFHTDQYSGADSYDDEDHCGNRHHHPNDDSSLHPTRVWSGGGGEVVDWRKRYTIYKARLLQVLSSANTKHGCFKQYNSCSCTQSAINLVWWPLEVQTWWSNAH